MLWYMHIRVVLCISLLCLQGKAKSLGSKCSYVQVKALVFIIKSPRWAHHFVDTTQQQQPHTCRCFSLNQLFYHLFNVFSKTDKAYCIFFVAVPSSIIITVHLIFYFKPPNCNSMIALYVHKWLSFPLSVEKCLLDILFSFMTLCYWFYGIKTGYHYIF